MSGEIKSHRDLRVWQQAYGLGLLVYRATESFPKGEQFGLTSQLRRSAVSVPSNIAEGYGRGHRNEYSRFLKIARGSLCELDTQLRYAADLGYLRPTTREKLTHEVGECSKMLAGLIRRIDRPPESSR